MLFHVKKRVSNVEKVEQIINFWEVGKGVKLPKKMLFHVKTMQKKLKKIVQK